MHTRLTILALLCLPALAHAQVLTDLAVTCSYPPGVTAARAALERGDDFGGVACTGDYVPLAQPADGLACDCPAKVIRGATVFPWCSVIILETDSQTTAACVSSYPQSFVVVGATKVLRKR
jgi:hypothetical protein